jgi:hypothetical protein
MASCPKCNKFYQPTPEDEKLMTSGLMEELCMDCAISAARKRDAGLPPAVPPPLRETFGKTDGTKLARVERFDSGGLSKAFVALPLLPNKPISHTLRKERKGDLGVMIFSEGSSLSRMPNEPRVILHTNLTTFRETGHPLWFSKIPSYWCPFTGVPRIEVPNEDVVDVNTDDTGATILGLQDGGSLRLTYR